MGIKFTNNWKNISDKIRSILRAEFKGTLPVFINDEPVSAGNQFLQLDLLGSNISQKFLGCELRQYSIGINFTYKNPNIKKTSLDYVLRYVSRIEQLVQNNISLTLADSTVANNCRIQNTSFQETEDAYIISFNFICQHASGLSEVISTTPTFNNINSLNFDGTNDHLDAGNNSSLVPTSAMTVSAWIKVDWDNSPAFPRIVDKNFTSYRLAIDKLSVEKSLFFFINGQFAKSTANALNTDNWQHVVGVFDKSLHSSSNSIRLYINGSEASYITQQSTGGDIASTSDNLHIGSDITDDAYFAGNIDEVAIWDTALDAEAVAAIYNSGAPTNLLEASGNYDEYTDNLQAYWRMGDGTLDSFPLIADQTDTSFGTDIFVSTGRTAMALGTSVDKDDGSAGWVVGGTLTAESGGFLKLVSGGSTTRIYDQLSGISGKVLKVSLDYRSNKPIGFSTDYFTPLVFFDKTSDNTGTDLLTDDFTSISFFVRAKTSGSNFWGQLRLLGTHQNIASTPSVGDELHLKNIKTSILNGNPALMTNMQSTDIVEDTP